MSNPVPRRSITESSAFDDYARELFAWIEGRAGDAGSLYRSGLALCVQARAHGMYPEHVLMALQSSRHRPADTDDAGDLEPATRDARYLSAIRGLIESCFGETPALRVVRARDGQEWTIMLVREGMRWDPEIEMRRKDWLCCASAGDRRYIVPVPLTWEQWTDDDLVVAILQAKPDLRGPT